MSDIDIKIIGGADATNTDLITWLEANGTITPTGTPYEYIKYDNNKVLVDAAIRDGEGKIIAENYAHKFTVGEGLTMRNNVICANISYVEVD